MHIDVNVGKQLSALGHTLTTLAAFEEEDDDILERENVLADQDLPDFAGMDISTRSVSQVSRDKFVMLSKFGNNLENPLSFYLLWLHYIRSRLC